MSYVSVVYSRSRKNIAKIAFIPLFTERLNGNGKMAFVCSEMVWSVLALEQCLVHSIVSFWQEGLTHTCRSVKFTTSPFAITTATKQKR